MGGGGRQRIIVTLCAFKLPSSKRTCNRNGKDWCTGTQELEGISATIVGDDHHQSCGRCRSQNLNKKYYI